LLTLTQIELKTMGMGSISDIKMSMQPCAEARRKSNNKKQRFVPWYQRLWSRWTICPPMDCMSCMCRLQRCGHTIP